MKKFLLICLSVLVSSLVYADGSKTCKVKGTTGSVEVSVYETNPEEGKATVRFSNDTNENVNVTCTIKSNTGHVRSVTKLVYANKEAEVEVSIGKAYDTLTVSTVSGTKCE